MTLLGGVLDSLVSGDERAREAEERLESVASIPAAPLRGAPAVETVAEVEEHADTGEPILVPVVVCPVEIEEQPPMDAVYRYVAAVCDALREAFADAHVRQFDVRFEFGPDRLLRSRTCRRVTVSPELAERLAEPRFDYRDLAAEVHERDDGDVVTPPVAWGECRSYHAGGGAAGAAAAGGAAAGCGGGAGGGC